MLDAINSEVHWISADNQTHFDWTIEKDFILDGYPYGYSDERSESGAYTFTDTLSLTILQGVSACVDNARWTSFSVDPTLGLLFTGGSLDSSPSTSSGKKVPVAAIVVPVVLILVIVIVIVLLVSFVPAVRYAVLPYRKRDSKRGNTGQTDRSSGWNQGQKPAQLS